MVPAAAAALELFETLHTPADDKAAPAPGPATDGTAAGSASSRVEGALDTQSVAHDSRLDYANHVDLTDPMTDARMDQLMAEGSLRVGQADFSKDIACCVTYSRKGTGATFGSPGDGLDVVGNVTEMLSVLDDPSARIKVVRLINYCGGPGNNIIGCAWVGDYGAMVVRRSNLGSETVLWVHEYGHNTDLRHNRDSRYIMHGIDFGTNNAVKKAECNRFHDPVSAANADIVETGACNVGEPGCGDGACEGNEDQCNCPADCGAAPLMELNCSDGNDNDCDNDVDCADVDCSALPACQCGLKADPCLTDSDCCSNKCRGKPDAKTCK